MIYINDTLVINNTYIKIERYNLGNRNDTFPTYNEAETA